MKLSDLASAFVSPLLSEANRAIRLRLMGQQPLPPGVLLAQRVEIDESLCGELTGHITCISTRTDLPLQALQGLAIEVQLVTDLGDLRRFCMISTGVRAGQSDGGLAVFQLTGRDALSLMEGRCNTRVFRQKSVIDITRVMLDEWRRRSSALAGAFDYVLRLDPSLYPKREFNLQCNETDADFLRRIWKRAGIAWFFRPGEQPQPPGGYTPQHVLVLFDDARSLDENAAGEIRYHRLDGTEQRDSINLWAPATRLAVGKARRSSWDYKTASPQISEERTILDQGESANDLARLLRDAQIEAPHSGDSQDDFARLTRRRIQWHELQAGCVQGGGGVRDLAVGEWNRIAGHAELDRLGGEEREYVFIDIRHRAENNLPKALNEQAQTLLAASEQSVKGWAAAPRDLDQPRYLNRFTAVRRGTPLVPAWNPREDLPPTPRMTALVVGPPGQEIWCDELARVKVEFQGLDAADHAHASGAGTNHNDASSAWVRVDFGWAGADFGVIQPLRVGMEVDVDFMGGDPDRPVITGTRYNSRNPPPSFSNTGDLPANRCLSGIKTREVFGQRYNQLRFDDTRGQISAQLESEHGSSQLNLGYLTQPRSKGRGEPRGEGAELRSDRTTAIRGAQGVLISSDKQSRAVGQHLQRDELIGLARTLQGIVEQLGELADTHQTSGSDPARFRQLVQHLEAWEHGSNTAREQGPGGAPIVAVSAAAGAGVFSQDNLALGAQSHIDSVSAGHTQLSAGQQIRQRAGTGVSTFAHTGNIETVAGKGLVDLQSHQGDIHLTASGAIVLTAGTKVVIQAPEVHVISQGAQTGWGSSAIVEQASGSFTVKAGRFEVTTGGDGTPMKPSLPKSELPFDQRVLLTDLHTAEPLPHVRYRITVEDGQVLEGVSDAEGMTQVFQSDLPYAHYTIELFR